VITPAREFDWAEAERRERRRDLLAIPGLVAFFVGIILLTGGFGFWSGGAAWAVVGGFLAFILLMTAASHVIPRLRGNTSAGYRIQAALRHHVDPGPELGTRTDRQARYWAGIAWVGWGALLGPLGLLLGGQWDRPLAASVGAVLMVGAAVGWVSWWRTRRVTARHWVADPPGPERKPPPLTTAERWMTGRRVAVVVGSLVALGLVIGLVGALIGRS
jgi:hypothetical protein